MYRYTKSDKYLGKESRDFYETNGYVVVPNLVDSGLLDECKQRFVDYCNGTAVHPIRLTMLKDKVLEAKNAKGEYLIIKVNDYLYDNVFFKYANYEPLVNLVESIIGPNITAAHSMLVNKPPDAEKALSEHPTHQDLHYFPFRPADSIVASWTAMEHIDGKNGCLFVVPGSHKSGNLYSHDYNKESRHNFMYHEAQGVPGTPSRNLCMEKGDTVLFHPLLLHGSGPNLTKGFRKAISCHYADTNCDFIDVKGTVQENIEREVMYAAKKKYRTELGFTDVWKLKSRLVRGEKGNFQNLSSKM